jgi:hypothetical protein
MAFQNCFKVIGYLGLTASVWLCVNAYAADSIVKDAKGCGIFDAASNPKPNRTVIWNGRCENGLAQGYGAVEWFVDGTLVVHRDGFLKDGKQFGHGTAVYPDGTKVEGVYENGRIVHGEVKCANGNHYDGDFKNGKPEGFGTLLTKNGKYTGDFVDNKQEGHGVWLGNDGKRFDGEWKNGAPLEAAQGEVTENGDGNSSGPQGDPQICAQFLEGIRNNCPNAAGGGPPAIYCGTSRSMYISSGCDQSALVGDSNFGTVTVNIQNVGQRSSANAAPLAPRVTSQTAGVPNAVYDKGLDQCVKIGGDGQSVYFENGCNASLMIAFNQPAGMGVGMQDCGPVSRCTFGIFGVGYNSRTNTVIAVCPKGDYVEASPGVQWAGSGPFRCRRP